MNENILNRYLADWRGVVTNPWNFFKNMPVTGGYQAPLIFAVISFLVNGLLSAIFLRRVGFLAIITTPIGGIIGLFIGAAILLVCFKIVKGTGEYEATFRVLSYSSATQVATWIPYVGWIATLYGLYLVVVGCGEIHKVSTAKSVLAVLIPVIVIILIAWIAGLSFLLGLFQS